MITAGFLPWWPENPYQILLKRELNKLGVRVIGNPPLSLLRLLFGRDGLDVVHVHWPHGLYKNPWQFLHVLIMLVAYRLLKNNVVWTVHELEAYESRYPRIDAWFRAVLMKLCRRLFVHGEYTRHEVQAKHGFVRPIDIARHPSYIGWYKDEATREQARQKLGLPEVARVYLFFGYVKPYKGVEDLIKAFNSILDDKAFLLVVGKPLNEEIKIKIESLASANPRILTFLGYIADDDIQYFFRAADVVVFPFRNTQTSGSLMLALSYGRPVVAPAIATLPEYINANIGILFDPICPVNLTQALSEAASAPLEDMAKAARRQAESLTWVDMARIHLASYLAIIGEP